MIYSSKVIFVNGAPATGKTHLSKLLAEEFRLPLYSRDSLKESMFEYLGLVDREWNKKIGGAAGCLLNHILEQHLRYGRSLILDSNFPAMVVSDQIRYLLEQNNAHAFQVLLCTDLQILRKRYRERIHHPSRHSGHELGVTDQEIEDMFQKNWEPLDIPGELLRLDTTDFEDVDYDLLFNRLATFLDADTSS